MEQVNKFNLFDMSKQPNFVVLNAILSLLYLIAIYIAFLTLLSGLEDSFKFLLVLSIVLLLLVIRFSVSVVFGYSWENNHKKLSKNYVLGFFTIVGLLDLLLVFYFVFYFQINDLISSELLSIILLPIIIITVASLLICGIENALYAFMLGLLSIALFIDPINVHHTMGEFVIMYSVGSTLILSPFYILPGFFVGEITNKMDNEFLNSKKILKLVLMAIIPLLLISIAHLGFYSIVFGSW